MASFLFTTYLKVYKAHINNCKYRCKVVVNMIFMHIILDLQAVYTVWKIRFTNIYKPCKGDGEMTFKINNT